MTSSMCLRVLPLKTVLAVHADVINQLKTVMSELRQSIFETIMLDVIIAHRPWSQALRLPKVTALRSHGLISLRHKVGEARTFARQPSLSHTWWYT